MPSNTQQSLKTFEGLGQKVAEALQSAFSENRALKEKLARMDADHKRVKEELREAKLTLARHDRLKARLVKLSEKLEKSA